MAQETADWRTDPFRQLRRAAGSNEFWRSYLTPLTESNERVPFSVHLAVLRQPYLDYVLEGTKTIESRFSAMRCAPYERVMKGDVLLLKASGGPVVGLCLVGHVWFYQLDPASWRDIRSTFTDELCAQDPEFWRAREHTSFATLMEVEQAACITPVFWKKRDRRGWVVLQARGQQADLAFD